MVRPSLITGALLTTLLAAGHSQAATYADGDSAVDELKVQFAQGGDGGGDSAGRGPGTSKGAVPQSPPEFPTGIGNPGTAPVPPSNPSGSAGAGSGSSSAPGAAEPGEYTPQTPGAPGTGLRSPGTESQGGNVRPEK
jgi:hypothetical protein